MSEVVITEIKDSIKKAVYENLSKIEKLTGDLIKSSNKVYIKPNGIDFKKHCFTSPEVLEAVILYFKEKGAEIYVMENSTQSNATRIVFEVNGYKEVCKKTGATPIYLDEDTTEIFQFKGKKSAEETDRGYNLKKFHLPKTVVEIMNNRDKITYINLPKLKEHSMAGVTLGMKNQWGFPQHCLLLES